MGGGVGRGGMAEATVGRFPPTPAAKESAGLPFGCTVTPLEGGAGAGLADNPPGRDVLCAEAVARCRGCYAYINGYCLFRHMDWTCSLCGEENAIPENSRYADVGGRSRLPELRAEIAEAPYLDEEPALTNPVYVALVDVAGGEDALDLIRSSVMAALEALDPGALFGLISFSESVTLHLLGGGGESVSVPVQAALEGCPTAEELEAALPLEGFLVPAGEHKEDVSAALDALEPLGASQGILGAGSGPLRQGREGTQARAFGPAIEAVVAYLAGLVWDEEGLLVDPYQDQGGGGGLVSGRVMAFLTGPPSLGRGSVSAAREMTANVTLGHRPEISAELASELLSPGTDFYRSLGHKAGAYGVACDLWVLSSEFVDLASMTALCSCSGGGVFYSDCLERAQFPQDIFSRLQRQQGVSCSLKLRTSPEFTVVRHYGPLVESPKYELLYNLPVCDQFDSFAFDFEFRGAGFGEGSEDTAPSFQVAFQYSVLVPVPLAERGGGRGSHVVQRRLRIITKQEAVAPDQIGCCSSVRTESVMAILMHKLTLASLTAGLQEGKLLMRDWLVILVSHFNLQDGRGDFEVAAASGGPVDTDFKQASALQDIPRYVYGLLRSPVMAFKMGGTVPDERAYLLNALTRRPPKEVAPLLFPRLESFKDHETPSSNGLPLNQVALTSSPDPIFLLDSGSEIVVFYRSSEGATQYPPPSGSALRKRIGEIRGGRSTAPKLTFLHGDGDSQEFSSMLLEDACPAPYDGGGENGFPAFLEAVARDVRTYVSA